MVLAGNIRRMVEGGTVVETSSDAVARELLERSEPMWERDRFDPGHFTASGFVVSPDRGAFLVVEHRRLGRWLQPGGHFEPDDVSVDAAARREVREETGVHGMRALSARLLRIDAHAIPARDPEPEHVHVDLAMAYAAVSWDIGPIAEVLDARWVRFDDLATLDTDDAVRGGAAALRVLAR